MSTELYLVHASPADLQRWQQQGISPDMNNLYARLETTPAGWLLLDAHILGFMRHESPRHPALFEAVMAGTPFADSAMREEYPRCFTPAEVATLATQLDGIPETELRARFDTLRSIFGGASTGGTDAQAWDRLRARYAAVVAHYQAAADNGQAMLLLLA